ncbi:NADP-dependent phosphogluconate dehydrogenase [Namhaeicola litoreus]|uniref:6-phosphogluconate dehydrogenase, decarboxylating n=1 Tax=Namhaeicola litoreus TaxID=1052145 RepID=A0ABW3Y2S1_9FLAO
MIVVVMGVSGCGKTTVGKNLATKLGLPYFDADDFHSELNIKKMQSAIPLTDEDRRPWLESIAEEMRSWDKEKGAVLACSALKEMYRKVFNQTIKNIHWVYLNGDFDLIKSRLENRAGHYMKSDLLKSQFDTLEIPDYGIHIDIKEEPASIVKKIMNKLNLSEKSFFGIIGLGVMGQSLALNIADNNFSLSVYNRAVEGEEKIVEEFLVKNKNKRISGFTKINGFVDSLETPRKILIMIKAGKALDDVIEQLLPHLNEGDVLIDGGNSHFSDTLKRYQFLSSKGIHFVGSGISGGEEGARKGPSIMPGGSKEGYAKIAEVLEAISAKDKSNNPCCTYMGPDGSGHFVKMIHNGMEYAEMQFLSEIYGLLRTTMTNDEISEVFEDWQKGELSSYLLDISAKILKKKEGKDYLLDLVLDQAGNKGTGCWSSIAALELGQPTTVMTSALFARYISSFKSERSNLSQKIAVSITTELPNIDKLKNAYLFVKWINHQQGFALIKAYSEDKKWQLNLSEISRIWTNGCIIKSALMEECVDYFKREKNLFDLEEIIDLLSSLESSTKEVLHFALEKRISLNSFSTAFDYWISMTTQQSTANMIQAQRDYFGAHTFQRIDQPENQYFHSNWGVDD